MEYDRVELHFQPYLDFFCMFLLVNYKSWLFYMITDWLVPAIINNSHSVYNIWVLSDNHNADTNLNFPIFFNPLH